jgi:hypothetical protein
MPLLANRLYVEGMVQMRMLPFRGEMTLFVQGSVVLATAP